MGSRLAEGEKWGTTMNIAIMPDSVACRRGESAGNQTTNSGPNVRSVNGIFAVKSRRASTQDPSPALSLPPWPVVASRVDPRVRGLEMLMRRNLHRPLRLPELAQVIGISASRLSHLFKSQTGVAPAQHLKSIRLQKAKDLLENPSLSVKVVAAQVGLDASRFIRDFRARYGVTPLQHRRASSATDGLASTDSTSFATHPGQPVTA